MCICNAKRLKNMAQREVKKIKQGISHSAKETQLEVKKMKQGMSYSGKEKTIILNVFKYFRTEFPDKCVTELVRRTSKATGCSEKSIFQFRKEEASAEGFKEPSKTKVRTHININSRFIKYDTNVRQSIRNIIYDLRYRNITPSLNAILKQIRLDDTLPVFSLMTLRRLLFDMGFTYEKSGNKFVLVEKDRKPAISKNSTANLKTVSNNISTSTNVNHEVRLEPKPEQPPLPNIINNQPVRDSTLCNNISDMNFPSVNQINNSNLDRGLETHNLRYIPMQEGSLYHLSHNVPMMMNNAMSVQPLQQPALPPPSNHVFHRMPTEMDMSLRQDQWIPHNTSHDLIEHNSVPNSIDPAL